MEQEAESLVAESSTQESGPQLESSGEILSFLNREIAETESAYQSELGPDGERLLALINQTA